MLVFDLDDTLYLERDFAFSGYLHLDRWVEATFSREGFGRAARDHFENGDRRRVFDMALADLEIPVSAELIGRLVSEYRHHAPSIRLCPDAAAWLKANCGGPPLGLITDGPAAMQRAKIEALDLRSWITHLRPTGDWGDDFGKPHPRAFQEMEDRAPTSERMIYVADNPAKDFVTPRARGWLCVQLDRPGAVHGREPPSKAHAAHIRIDSFDRLDAGIAALLR